MRILGFSKRWQKLSNPIFTTFRFTRKDRDWQSGEQVQVVYKPRSKEREYLGVAEILNKESRHILTVSGLSDTEARDDGFSNRDDMFQWLVKTYSGLPETMNKLTLRWVEKI